MFVTSRRYFRASHTHTFSNANAAHHVRTRTDEVCHGRSRSTGSPAICRCSAPRCRCCPADLHSAAIIRILQPSYCLASWCTPHSEPSVHSRFLVPCDSVGESFVAPSHIASSVQIAVAVRLAHG